MGATSWSHFTDWREDVGTALKELKLEVFRKGAFECRFGGDPHSWMDGLDELFIRAGEQPPKPPPIRPPGWVPATIDELLHHVGQNGTHSILDVSGVATQEEFGRTFPAPAEWLEDAYGTTRPTRKMVEAHEIPSEILQWRMVYFAVWEGDSVAKPGGPRWWYFQGNSGD